MHQMYHVYMREKCFAHIVLQTFARQSNEILNASSIFFPFSHTRKAVSPKKKIVENTIGQNVGKARADSKQKGKKSHRRHFSPSYLREAEIGSFSGNYTRAQRSKSRWTIKKVIFPLIPFWVCENVFCIFPKKLLLSQQKGGKSKKTYFFRLALKIRIVTSSQKKRKNNKILMEPSPPPPPRFTEP